VLFVRCEMSLQKQVLQAVTETAVILAAVETGGGTK
jgi:hypothetical protein